MSHSGAAQSSSPQPIGNTSNGGRERDAHPLAGCRPKPSRNSRGSKFSQPSPSMYAAWAAQRRRRPRRRCRWCRRRARAAGSRPPRPACTPPHGSSPSTSCSGKTQRLPASRTASSTARPVAMWSAWLRFAAAPGLAEVAGDHDLGPVPAHDGGDRAAQRHAVLEDAVGQAEELDGVDADDPRRLDLLGLADPAALVGVHAVDAGLAAGDHAVDDLLALAGPAGDGGGGAELHVVGVRDDGERAAPVLVERLERRWARMRLCGGLGHCGSPIREIILRRLTGPYITGSWRRRSCAAWPEPRQVVGEPWAAPTGR